MRTLAHKVVVRQRFDEARSSGHDFSVCSGLVTRRPALSNWPA